MPFHMARSRFGWPPFAGVIYRSLWTLTLVALRRPVTNWPVCVWSTSETETSPVAWERKHQPNPERVTLNQSPTEKESRRETASWARPEIKVPLSQLWPAPGAHSHPAWLALHADTSGTPESERVHSRGGQPSRGAAAKGEVTLEAQGCWGGESYVMENHEALMEPTSNLPENRAEELGRIGSMRREQGVG